MGLVDVIESKDIEQLQQVLLGALDRGKAILEELRDGTRVKITIEFERKETRE